MEQKSTNIGLPRSGIAHRIYTILAKPRYAFIEDQSKVYDLKNFGHKIIKVNSDFDKV